VDIAFTARLDAEERAQWLGALQAACPGHRWIDLGDASAPRGAQTPLQADVAVVANPAPGALAGLTGLRLVQSLWAGVEKLLADTTLPREVPLARMVDPSMNDAMAETALWAVLSLHRGFFDYAQQQRDGVWHQRVQRRAEAVRVLVLGFGAMGRAVSARLAACGYRVTAWRREGSQAGEAVAGVAVIGGRPALDAALPQAEVLINLLPVTPQTRGVLSRPLLDRLPRGAGVVNLGRGAHLVEADLLAALADGSVGRAVLDVFAEEPLPAGHPFWAHPRVTVLPHVAALTDLGTASAVVADNLRRLAQGEPLRHLVDRARGY
jgi:glyoxylate/hydroxypyruvate reductase A